MNSGSGSHNGPLRPEDVLCLMVFSKDIICFSLIQNTNKEKHQVFPSHFPSPTLTQLRAGPFPPSQPQVTAGTHWAGPTQTMAGSRGSLSSWRPGRDAEP